MSWDLVDTNITSVAGSSRADSRIGESALAGLYRTTREATEALCEPLATEDYVVQSMADASPTKWHLAHTTWFFETFVLSRYSAGYRPYHPEFATLFNSYYQTVGPQWPRPRRGVLSRPTVDEVYRYRAYVDQQMEELFRHPKAKTFTDATATILLGVHHEQQHQELILTDLKHAFGSNSLHPVYRERAPDTQIAPPRATWIAFPEGVAWIGHDGSGFAFDNELPRHRVFLHRFRIASHLVTNEEYANFVAEGGYERPELWLSDGWAARQAHGWTAPLYWEEQGKQQWSIMTLAGLRPLQPAEPVCHVSYYEADAFARWAGARLPTEQEWETAAAAQAVVGHFLEGGCFHPAAATAADDRGPLYRLYGDVWQWTASPYVAYPGYQPPPGALGEYNGKFMSNQYVLRGASCATPRSHARLTYRNFFPPHARWQFSGIRLAADIA
jgi:ergothioneine biosynthesis protein EgtB